MVRGLETQTVASNSIPLHLHVVLELNKHTLTLPCSVRFGFWNSEHDETQKWAMGQQERLPPPHDDYIAIYSLCAAVWIGKYQC